MQGLAAEAGCQQQAIILQRVATLDKLANGIIGPMQREGMDDQVMAFSGEREGVGILDNRGLGQPRAPDVREAGHNRDICKVPVNHGEAIFDVVSHEGLQEHAPVQIRALAIAHKGCAVGQCWGRFGHGRYLG